ncbi:hypothetical protein [uncultured Maricaulis sp.]|uniref:general secretion pathway protein GspK n=1 Tax=uncultured Maricaulis sp. TaxID=174710 RepID=UPI0030D997EE|tara:strand:- start:92965 stop:93801 length:837 start_codon:yes stop_codon:yes gene_type:complete
MTRSQRQRADRGSALITAVAMTVVLATFAVLSIHLVLDTAFFQQGVREEDRLDAAFQTAFALALHEVASRSDPIQYGDATRIETDAGAVSVRWFSPDGRVDLNAAPPTLLALALQAAGADAPDRLASAILDWRDADDLVSNHGAEAQAYLRAGLPPPANRPFASEDELADILGMPQQILPCLKTYVTVSSWREAPDPTLAPPRLRHLIAPGQPDATAPPVTLGTGDLIGLDMSLDEGPDRGAGVWALVRLTGDPQAPYRLQAWDRIAASDPICNGARS